MLVLRVFVTRDSVCAGDDVDAPHEVALTIPDVRSMSELVKMVAARSNLPSIIGGKATWCLNARRPLAVVAQQWAEPRLLTMANFPVEQFVDPGAPMRLRWTYLVQEDPEIVFRMLDRLRFANEF